MAILRIGGRVPDAQGPDAAFLYGPPPLLRYFQPPGDETPPQMPEVVSPQIVPQSYQGAPLGTPVGQQALAVTPATAEPETVKKFPKFKLLRRR